MSSPELSLSAYMTFTHVKDDCALNYLLFLDCALRDVVSCSKEHLLSCGHWESRICAVTLATMLEFPCSGQWLPVLSTGGLLQSQEHSTSGGTLTCSAPSV